MIPEEVAIIQDKLRDEYEMSEETALKIAWMAFDVFNPPADGFPGRAA